MKHHKDKLPKIIDKQGVCFQGIDWSDWNVSKVQLPKGAVSKKMAA